MPAPKLALIPNTADQPLTTADLIDRIGTLEEFLLPREIAIKPFQNQLAELKKELGTRSTKRADEPDTLHGLTFSAVLGPRENATTFPMVKVFKLLKQKTFLEFCSFSIEKLKVLLPEQSKELLVSSRTGSRPVKTFRPAPESDAKAA